MRTSPKRRKSEETGVLGGSGEFLKAPWRSPGVKAHDKRMNDLNDMKDMKDMNDNERHDQRHGIFMFSHKNIVSIY